MENKDTLYARWLSGELSPEEIKTLKNSGEWEELEAIVKATGQLNLPPMNLDAAYRGVQRSRPSKRPKVVWRKYQLAIGAAAAIAFITALSLWLFFGTTEVRAAYGSTERHEFRDGSYAILNDGSVIRYRGSSWGRKRLVHLTGEAFFSVEKGPPFVVSAPNGKVEVLGTEFAVRNWGANLYVACYEGKVQATAGNKSIAIPAGKTVNFLPGPDSPVADMNRKSPVWIAESRSLFDREEANSVLEEIGRQYDIEIKAPPLDDFFSGGFPHDNLEKALEFVCLPLGLKYEVSPDQGSVNITRQ